GETPALPGGGCVLESLWPRDARMQSFVVFPCHLEFRLSPTMSPTSSLRRPVQVVVVAWFALSIGLPGFAAESKMLNALFIGNSFTGRHNLSQLVKAMAEAGNPGLHFEVTTVIYGGRTLRDHWRLGTQNFVKLATITPAEVRATIQTLEETLA